MSAFTPFTAEEIEAVEAVVGTLDAERIVLPADSPVRDWLGRISRPLTVWLEREAGTPAEHTEHDDRRSAAAALAACSKHGTPLYRWTDDGQLVYFGGPAPAPVPKVQRGRLLADLPLSSRTLLRMSRMRLWTAGAIDSMTDAELLALPGIGPKTLRELRKAVAA